MKRTIPKWTVNLVLMLVLSVSLVLLIDQQLDKAAGSSAYSDAAQLAAETTSAVESTEQTSPPAEEKRMVWMPESVTDDPVMEELKEISLAALRQVNPDVVGWIRIPDTKVDYPIMQGEDNDFYLNNTWEKKPNAVGSIFMEYQNDPNMGDYNTLIYGHNMKDGSMFAAIRMYLYPNFYEAHPYIYLVTDSGVLRYEIFSTYKAELDDDTYRLSFQQGQTRENFLKFAIEKSALEIGIEPGIRDRILTLSTCSGMGNTTRWVVHARLKLVQREI